MGTKSLSCDDGRLIGRRRLLLAAPAALGAAAISPALTRPSSSTGYFRVKILSINPPRFSVLADLPIDGDRLTMSDSYPAELPPMASGGWPTLISALIATDASGLTVELIRDKDRGWRLTRKVLGHIQLNYVVDFTIFADAGWPSSLESAAADEDHVAISARALFLTTDKVQAADIRFELPSRWQVAAPWPASPISRAYRASSKIDFTDNFVVFFTRPVDVVTAAGFRLQVATMGHWTKLTPLVRDTLQAIVTREVALMGYQQREAYNVVLVPMQDTGGEAYRQSFVYAFKDPTEANRGDWANTMAHEIFHYWNYARLQGADYASTQWFQEGFTEYVANLTVVGGGIITPTAFREKLAGHVANYRRLTTTLEAIGTHKGPPLYSAGALVAFTFDVMIRKATVNRLNIGSFFRNFWRYTNGGDRKYAWPDIEASLRGTVPLDWRGFYEHHIKGNEPLPLDRAFKDAGLLLQSGGDSSPGVLMNPDATPSQKLLWKRLISGD